MCKENKYFEREQQCLNSTVPVLVRNRRAGRGRARLLSPTILTISLVLTVATVADSKPDAETIMVVREWNPNTGELIGWLPTYKDTLGLSILDSHVPIIKLNEAVNVKWVDHPKECRAAGQKTLPGSARDGGSERWLLAKCDNVVRIARHLFLVRTVIFGESGWHEPNAPPLPAISKGERR